ncbi:uncharacterized protein EV422DRAFT_609141 [Fimicolochytrium jonesii]|uniref:uncharacterized protein n=1 Tax=Fimicolochytrium jonesii TaxID=1396493 RepID=UPI0022FE240E|nr:uncharacterized protein EV422DRAFT_609141 [Fimicolochytrium jonesii]KAI8824159.1 hypothetical protein EV422DRAFT_609141 [Fimicolochytrium jonesii]
MPWLGWAHQQAARPAADRAFKPTSRQSRSEPKIECKLRATPTAHPIPRTAGASGYDPWASSYAKCSFRLCPPGAVDDTWMDDKAAVDAAIERQAAFYSSLVVHPHVVYESNLEAFERDAKGHSLSNKKARPLRELPIAQLLLRPLPRYEFGLICQSWRHRALRVEVGNAGTTPLRKNQCCCTAHSTPFPGPPPDACRPQSRILGQTWTTVHMTHFPATYSESITVVTREGESVGIRGKSVSLPRYLHRAIEAIGLRTAIKKFLPQSNRGEAAGLYSIKLFLVPTENTSISVEHQWLLHRLTEKRQCGDKVPAGP